jgi:hypothetical protein
LRQITGGKGGGRGGALKRDLDGIEQSQRPTVARIRKVNGALNRWQPMTGPVRWEVAVDLRGDISLSAGQRARLDVKRTVSRLDFGWSRREATALGEQLKCFGVAST